jgi:hypothetical protein
MPKIEIDKELINRTKRILIEFSSPTIAMSALFEALGYSGVNGILWGILLGVVSTVATEMGYEVSKLGTIWTINKKPDTNPQKEGSDIGEKKTNG